VALRRYRWAVVVVVAVACGALLNEGLKDAFARERPTVVPHLMRVSSASFPSGHSMLAAILYPTLGELIARLMPSGRARTFLVGLGIGLAVAVGATRVYLGVHYPSDVLAGLTMGLAWALTCGLAARFLQRRQVAP
jgi:undecaprenyl-diphosphatase